MDDFNINFVVTELILLLTILITSSDLKCIEGTLNFNNFSGIIFVTSFKNPRCYYKGLVEIPRSF